MVGRVCKTGEWLPRRKENCLVADRSLARTMVRMFLEQSLGWPDPCQSRRSPLPRRELATCPLIVLTVLGAYIASRGGDPTVITGGFTMNNVWTSVVYTADQQIVAANRARLKSDPNFLVFLACTGYA